MTIIDMINDNYINIAIVAALIILIASIFFMRRKPKNDGIDMPSVEQDALMDKSIADGRSLSPDAADKMDTEIGRWGDGVLGKPRVVAAETIEERVARIHQESQQQQQQRQTEPRIHSIPASISRAPYQPPHRQSTLRQEDNTHAKKHPPKNSSMVVLYVMATEGRQFAGNDLYQSLINAGLMYGKMRIFHYHAKRGVQHDVLFSIASAVNPGAIDIDNMDSFKTPGLTLFMNVNQVQHPKMILETMIAVAEQLADDLDGIVQNDKREPWSTEVEVDCFAQFES